MNKIVKHGIKPMYLLESTIIFGIATVMLFIACYLVIPFLMEATGLPSVVCWYLSGGILVFLPMLITSLIFYKSEGNPLTLRALKVRFNLKKLSITNITFIIISSGMIIFLTLIVISVSLSLMPNYSIQPPFARMIPLSGANQWILLIWMPMFVLNIFGEEFLWRGYIFPRQELAHGKYTWLIHGGFWLMFHLPFGINLMLSLLPIIFIESYVFQKTKNSWVAIIIHSIVNGGGTLALAIGFA
jgi:membrane protease YdiL (CAAX protease family)